MLYLVELTEDGAVSNTYLVDAKNKKQIHKIMDKMELPTSVKYSVTKIDKINSVGLERRVKIKKQKIVKAAIEKLDKYVKVFSELAKRKIQKDVDNEGLRQFSDALSNVN